MTINQPLRQKKLPLEYTPKQLAQVKNGMPVKEFLVLYGESQRTRALYHKLKNMKTLGQVVQTHTPEPETPILTAKRLGGKLVRVNNEVFLRGQVLLDLYNGEPQRIHYKNKGVNTSLGKTLLGKGLVIKLRHGIFQITDIGKDYLETILDENRGFSTKYKRSFSKNECYYSDSPNWDKHRMSLSDVRKGFRPKEAPQNQKVYEPTPQKVETKTLWEKIRSFIPVITIKFQRA
jgi:hypothetical protein